MPKPTAQRVRRNLKVLELYCGIGGVAAAAVSCGRIALAVDQNRLALGVYGYNFDHPFQSKTVESLDSHFLKRLEADLWWASPPCQPFTLKGKRRQLADTRAQTLVLGILAKLKKVLPRFFALENVPGFMGSDAHALVKDQLQRFGYRYHWEGLLCPSELGLPNHRRRFFLMAGREPLAAPKMSRMPKRPLEAFLESDPPGDLELDPATLQRYQKAVDLVDPRNPTAVASCFTAGYGKSPVRCGSYLQLPQNRARYFSPKEVAALLGFPPWFAIPPQLSRRQAWKLLGNSLSIPCVRTVLSLVPSLP